MNKHFLTNQNRARIDCSVRFQRQNRCLDSELRSSRFPSCSRVLLLHRRFISDGIISLNTCKNIKRPEKLLGLRRRPAGAGFSLRSAFWIKAFNCAEQLLNPHLLEKTKQNKKTPSHPPHFPRFLRISEMFYKLKTVYAEIISVYWVNFPSSFW